LVLPTGFSFAALGKVGVILLVADIITGLVLGKNVFNMMSGDKSGDDKPKGWKDKIADDIMEKLKEKEAASVEKKDPDDTLK
jgi:hypothetical protein